MKKIFVLFLAILTTVVLSVSVLAATKLTCGGTPNSGEVQLGGDGNNTSDAIGLSAHVTAGYCSSTGDSYVAATYNDKGTKTYGTGSGTSNIYYKEGNYATVNSSTSFDSGWTKIGE